jgi:serine/threonine protein kinase
MKHTPIYYGNFNDRGSQCILLEYLPITIADYWNRPAVQRISRAEIAIQMLEALRSIHERGKIHRDVKPGNFMVKETAGERQDGAESINIPQCTVKIIDFGIINENCERSVNLGPYNFNGTYYFASTRALSGYIQNKIDDMEGLGYTLMSLIDPEKVPWNGLPTLDAMIKVKQDIISGDLETLSSCFHVIQKYL